MIMPGPVVLAHADAESDCQNCHQAFEGNAQTDLCLVCHDLVASDRKARTGFHGSRRGRSELECRGCHADHRGRKADIVGLTPETFNHDDTDFKLDGRHRAVACDSCHLKDQRHRAASSQCISCHEQIDPHSSRLGEKCGKCHESSGWQNNSFNHDETDFALLGAHASADCDLCHPAEAYNQTPKACSDCHASEDAHRGQMGPDCGQCHTLTSWRDAVFDHTKETRFGLSGKHREASCNECHLGKGASNFSEESGKIKSTCFGCHEVEDDHEGSFGESCNHCHTPSGWQKTTFNHMRDAKYELSGAHASSDCSQCHRGVLGKESIPTQCSGCHLESDLHAGQLGARCESCHGSASWIREIAFDHDMSGFPLLGIHAVAGCADCHSSNRFRDTSKQCLECHAKDDVHERTLGSDCQKCHTPNAWNLWRFGHEENTSFPLRGQHAGLECQACHSVGNEDGARLSPQCDACHSLDDPHRGSFGTRCQTCHKETSWRDTRTPR
jgi:hypothetical protein